MPDTQPTAAASAAIADDIKFLKQRYVERFPVADLADHPDNPKDHDLGSIIESIRENGFYGTLYAQDWPDTPHFIIAGHGRRDALTEAGVEFVPVVLIEANPRRALKILLSDNRTPQQGGFNDAKLYDVLTGLAKLDDLTGTGYTGDDVDDLRALQSPLDFGSIGSADGEELAYKAHESVIVHVRDIQQTQKVRGAIAELLAAHSEWTASIFAHQ
jgi:ParB-like nuclease domain